DQDGAGHIVRAAGDGERVAQLQVGEADAQVHGRGPSSRARASRTASTSRSGPSRIGSATGSPSRPPVVRISRSASAADRSRVLALRAITFEGRITEAIRS